MDKNTSIQSFLGNRRNFLDVCDKAGEGFDCGFFGQSFDAAQAYLKIELIIACLIERLGKNGKAEKFVAVIQKAIPFYRSKLKSKHSMLWNYDGVEIYGPYHDQKSVFISKVQSMKKPERAVPVPSLIWFQPFDEAYSIGANIFDLLFDLVFEDLLRLPERKFTVLDVGSRLQAMAGDKVEGGSGVVDYVARDGTQPRWRGLLDLESPDPFLMAIPRFLLCNDGIEISPPMDGNNGPFKLCKVLLRPFDFGARSSFWFSVRGDHIEASDAGIVVYDDHTEVQAP